MLSWVPELPLHHLFCLKVLITSQVKHFLLLFRKLFTLHFFVLEGLNNDKDSQQLQQLPSQLSDSFPSVTSGSSSLPQDSDEDPEVTAVDMSGSREGNCRNESSEAGTSGSADKSSKKRGMAL